MSNRYEKTSYEWTRETLSTDDPNTPREEVDIIDSDFRNESEGGLEDFRQYIGNPSYRVGLVRDIHDTRDGNLEDRTWAYFDNTGAFPDQFEDGTKVPQKYLKEARK